jgi:hypothetical protein
MRRVAGGLGGQLANPLTINLCMTTGDENPRGYETQKLSRVKKVTVSDNEGNELSETSDTNTLNTVYSDGELVW